MLSLRDVHVHIGKLHILQGVSMEVKEGECAALLGRNGVGKTTTLRSIMGLVARTHGVIEFDGDDLSNSPPHLIPRKGIGYVPQGRGIFPTLSVLENLMIGVPGMRDAAQQEYVLSCFPRLKERLKQSGSTLSGGEQQMLAIARCLMMRPKLIILDEPTEGIMPRLVSQIRREIHRINQSGVSILSARACFSWKKAPSFIRVPRTNSSHSPRSCTDTSGCLTKLRTHRENEHGKKVIPPQFS
jgi:branched-chain amino acid transport system ATP-binding protein